MGSGIFTRLMSYLPQTESFRDALQSGDKDRIQSEMSAWTKAAASSTLQEIKGNSSEDGTEQEQENTGRSRGIVETVLSGKLGSKMQSTLQEKARRLGVM